MISARVRNNIVIRRPIEDVFKFLATDYIENSQRLSPPSDEVVVAEIPTGPIDVGFRWNTLAKDARGYMVNTDAKVTKYMPPSRFVLEQITSFAEEQPNKLPPPQYAKSKTYSYATYVLSPGAEGTLLSVEAVYRMDMHKAYLMYVPTWSNRLRAATQKRLGHLRDILEAEVGLRPEKPGFHFSRSWFGWILYFVVLGLLLWVHGAHDALGLTQQWIDALRITMSLMIVGAFMFVLVTKTYFR